MPIKRELLRYFLRHPAGLQVLRSWYADAGAGKIGPGDLLDQKYPAHFHTFMKRCAEIVESCQGLHANSWGPRRKAVLDMLVVTGKRERFSLAPKDVMLISLGTYLISNAQSLPVLKTRTPIIPMLQQLRLQTSLAADVTILNDIATCLGRPVIQPIEAPRLIDNVLKTNFGHPLLLESYAVMKTYPALRKLAVKKGLTTRKELYNLAREFGYSHVVAITQINWFLEGKIVSRSSKMLNQLMPFAAKLCDYLDGKPEIMFAGAYPIATATTFPAALRSINFSRRGNSRKSSAPQPC